MLMNEDLIMNPLLEVKRFGQSIWLDNLSRDLIRKGSLKQLIEQDGLSGVTSNPSIFHKALTESAFYKEDLAKLKSQQLDAEQRYEALVIPDIQAACDLMLAVYEATLANDGYVSLEVSPKLAYDVDATVAAAVNRKNLLVKVPSTPEGIKAFEKIIGLGISVNVTLMFSLHHVVQVAQAYMRGLRHWLESGGDAKKIKAVASIFLSRVDTLVDKKLEAIGTSQAMELRGKAAVAMSILAYQRYKQLFHGAGFQDLKDKGARPQYMLWASTGTKNPNYSDVKYIETLIGPETVNTVPDATLAAFRDHGKADLTLEKSVKDAEEQYLAIESLGIDMTLVGEQLQVEGVKLFDEAFTKLLNFTA
jgi:transaldolase